MANNKQEKAPRREEETAELDDSQLEGVAGGAGEWGEDPEWDTDEEDQSNPW